MKRQADSEPETEDQMKRLSKRLGLGKKKSSAAYKQPSIGLILPSQEEDKDAMMEVWRLLHVDHGMLVETAGSKSDLLGCAIVLEKAEQGKESLVARQTVEKLETECKPSNMKSELYGQKPFHRAAILAKQGERFSMNEAAAAIQTKVTSGKNQVVVVHGNRGSGKSALLGLVCRDAGLFEKDGNCVGAHFFSAQDEASLSARSCLFSLSQQIASFLPHVSVEGAKASDIDDLTSLFRTLIANPCTRIESPGENKFVIVDGLDDSDKSAELRSILEELWAKECPHWLGVVFSSTFCNPSTSDFAVPSQLTFASMSTSLKEQLKKVFPADEDDVNLAVSLIESQSNEFPLLATALVQEVERAAVQAPVVTCGQLRKVFGTLPESARKDFDWHVKNLLVRAPSKERTADLLSALAASRSGALDRETVAEILGEMGADDQQELTQLLQGAFIVTSDKDGSLRVAHPWFKAALEQQLDVDAKAGHKLLAELLSKRPFSAFALRDMSFHLRHANQFEVLEEFLLSFDWLYQATSVPDNVYSLLEDSAALAESSEPVRAVVRALRRGCWHIAKTRENEDLPLLPSVGQWLLACIEDQAHPTLKGLFEYPQMKAGSFVMIPTADWLNSSETLPMDSVMASIVVCDDVLHVMGKNGRCTTVDIESEEVVAVFNFNDNYDEEDEEYDDSPSFRGMARVDNKLIAWSSDAIVAVDANSGRPLFTVEEQIVTCAAGKSIMAVASGQSVLVYGLESDNMYQLAHLKGHAKKVTCVAISECESLLVSSGGKELRIWDWVKNEQIRTVSLDAPAHHLGIYKGLAWCCADDELSVYGARDESRDSSSKDQQGLYRKSPDVFSGFRDFASFQGSLAWVDTHFLTGNPRAGSACILSDVADAFDKSDDKETDKSKKETPATRISPFQAQMEKILADSGAPEIYKEMLRASILGGSSQSSKTVQIKRFDYRNEMFHKFRELDTNDVELSPSAMDDKYFVSGCGTSVAIWDVETGKFIKLIKGHRMSRNAVKRRIDKVERGEPHNSPRPFTTGTVRLKDNTLISCDQDGVVKIADISTKETLHVLECKTRKGGGSIFGPAHSVWSADVDLVNQVAVTAVNDEHRGSQVVIWDLSGDEPTRRAKAKVDGVCVALHPEFVVCCTGSEWWGTNKCSVLDVNSGEELYCFPRCSSSAVVVGDSLVVDTCEQVIVWDLVAREVIFREDTERVTQDDGDPPCNMVGAALQGNYVAWARFDTEDYDDQCWGKIVNMETKKSVDFSAPGRVYMLEIEQELVLCATEKETFRAFHRDSGDQLFSLSYCDLQVFLPASWILFGYSQGNLAVVDDAQNRCVFDMSALHQHLQDKKE